MAKTLCLLLCSSNGYALFERTSSDELMVQDKTVQKDIVNLERFSKMVQLRSFIPFTTQENALENMNAASDGDLTEFLAAFLELHLPESTRKDFELGVLHQSLGKAIQATLNIKCKSNELTMELLRGCRLHLTRFVKGNTEAALTQSQLSLGHSYSRSKVKFNVHKVDNMIIQAIALVDQFDKDLNTYSMRVREWYGYHFPEVAKIVKDNYLYCKTANTIKDKSKFNADIEEQLSLFLDEESVTQLVTAVKSSMGCDISPIDLINIEMFSKRVTSMFEYRADLYHYLVDKMETCAPNLTALLGEQVGARLISHAGSLTNLAKYPASTVQILGAEKALFRALKTKGNTPKFGLIFRSSFIGRAAPKNKGRISRCLANKCALASRIDCFSGENPTNEYGLKFKEQVEERLEFYKTGKAPGKNLDAMAAVKESLAGKAGSDTTTTSTTSAMVDESSSDESKKKKKKDKKRSLDMVDDVKEEVSSKKAKKDKKSKKKSKK